MEAKIDIESKKYNQCTQLCTSLYTKYIYFYVPIELPRFPKN